MKKIILTLSLAITSLCGISQNHSLNFDGVDDYVTLGDNYKFDNTDQFSVEAWVKMVEITGFHQIVSKLDSNFRGWGLQISDSGVIGGYLFSSFLSNQRYAEGTTNLVDNTWHHVAMTFNGEDIQLYVDGVLDEISGTNNLGELETIDNTASVHIGSYDANGTPEEFFNGNIDEVRIWNDLRTVEEIEINHLLEMTGAEDNLVGYYKMDEVDSMCDVNACSVSAIHGMREGSLGSNDHVQFSTDVPNLMDVACGEEFECILSVEEVNSLEFNVFPNPTNGMLEIVGLDGTISEVRIVNVLGSEVKVLTNGLALVDMTYLPSGMYFITVVSNGQRETKKVIKR